MKCFISLLFVFIFSCSKDPSLVLKETIANYKQNRADVTELKIALLRASALKTYNAGSIEFIDRWPVCFHDKSVIILYPEKKEYPLSNGSRWENLAQAGEIVAFSDGKKISVFDKKNNRLNFYKTVDDKKIFSVQIFQDRCFFVESGTLNELNLFDGQVTSFQDKSLKQISSDFVNIKLYATESLIIWTTGIGGSYYAHIFDPAKKRFIVTNIGLASDRIAFSDNKLFYVAGSSGEWHLHTFDVKNKKKRKVYSFNNFRDLWLFPDGVVMCHKERTFFLFYDNLSEESKLSLAWHVVDCNGDIVFIKEDEILYALDFTDFTKLIDETSSQCYLTKKSIKG